MLRVLCSQEGDAPKNTAGMLRARVPPSPARSFQPRATKNGWRGEDAGSVPTQPRVEQVSAGVGGQPVPGTGNASCPAG